MKKKSLDVLLFISACLFSLLIIELGARIYLFGAAAFSYDKMNSITGLGLSGLIQPSEHEDIVYELKSNQDAYLKLAKFRTNSFGMRDKEYSLSKPDNAFRIAVLGDSMTLPAGVEIEDAYHSRLEELSNEVSGGDRVEVLNFGVGGYQLKQYFAVLKHKAMKFSPDLVFIGFCGWNDHIIFPNAQVKFPYTPAPKEATFFNSYSMALYQHIQRQWGTNNTLSASKYSRRQTQYMQKVFKEIEQITAKDGIPVVVGFLSTQPTDTIALKAIVEKQSNMRFLNLSEPFDPDQANSYSIYLLDAHPNDVANGIFAKQIFDYLYKEKLIPLSTAGN
jgi:hypothetical protein